MSSAQTPELRGSSGCPWEARISAMQVTVRPLLPVTPQLAFNSVSWVNWFFFHYKTITLQHDGKEIKCLQVFDKLVANLSLVNWTWQCWFMPCPEMEDNNHTFLISGHVSPGNFFIEIKRVPLFPFSLSEISIKPIEQHHCGLGHCWCFRTCSFSN